MQGSGGPGGPEATGDPGRGDAGPVRATEPKSEDWGGRRDPLSPRPAFPGLRRVLDSLGPVQFGGSGAPPGSVLPLVCLALFELALTGVRQCTQSGPRMSVLRPGRRPEQPENPLSLARQSARSTMRKVRIPSSPGGGAAAVVWGTGVQHSGDERTRSRDLGTTGLSRRSKGEQRG